MWVFGDLTRLERPELLLERLRDRLAQVGELPAGLERHSQLVAALIEAGELTQGLTDALFAEQGTDRASAQATIGLRLCLALGSAVTASYESGFARGEIPGWQWVEAIARAPLPGRIEVRRPEGYSYYALYPEAYALAARGLPHDGRRLVVIGIRSIGTSLAGMVAAAAKSRHLLTVRPVGHPFSRTLSLSPSTLRWLSARAKSSRFAIVDEGPGLSGSSFGAVADVLEEAGAAPDRLVFLTSHLGPLGPNASPRHRARWARSDRRALGFDEVFGASALTAWTREWVGEPIAPTRDLSAGAWRELLFASKASWPPAHPRQERRKLLMRSARGEWLLKFAGLGRAGEAALERGKQLSRGGFIPEVLGLRHGFLVQRWVPEARPLPVASFDRRGLLEQLAGYLAFLFRNFPAAGGAPGATLQGLLEMARHNTALALGERWAELLECWRPRVSAIDSTRRPIAGDCRLHAWEWLALPDGRFLKADALEHHRGHDLVGCQDLAWDVAGASVELDLTALEQESLLEALGRARGAGLDRTSVEFHRRCYLAFQLGSCALATGYYRDGSDERQRLQRAADGYALRLRQSLELG